ncbi:MAG: TonB-dependent receptor [Flavobacteriaceae bacterium]
MKKFALLVFAFMLSTTLFAQSGLSGQVVEQSTKMPIPGANVKVVGQSVGAITDFDGNFDLELQAPFTIEVSMMGYGTQKIEITDVSAKIVVELLETVSELDAVVVSASRTPERIMESPVTVERMDARAIQATSSATFYDGLANLKGVDINTNALTFKSINTRGFASFGNTRFMQLVDGMDNASPALNFSLGNLLGMSELDVNTVELLPGASSALYGANAFNGILFMSSKSPFDFEGTSTYVKSGVTSQDAAGTNLYYDVGIRFAKKVSDKFAFKLTASFLEGTDWYATDYRDYSNPGATRENTLDYDGLNVYGDEVAVTMDFDEIAASLGLPLGGLGTDRVSRTGYNEVDLMDYEAKSFKAGWAFHFRPFKDDTELIYNGKVGTGNTIYQGSNRYALDKFFMQQHKLEVRNRNFFARVYMTDENAGDSYDTRFAAININRDWKGDTEWFTEYAQAYILGRSGLIPGVPALDYDAAHKLARQTAQVGAYVPGSPEFNEALDRISADPDFESGAKFTDQSRLYHGDLNYNFNELVKTFDWQVGGSWRMYDLNSSGTIYTDAEDPISYNEYGVYTQIQDKFIDDRLKLTASIRYDKSQVFDGSFSPRVSVSYGLGERKNRNIRASFQTGFRNPTTQDLYIGLDSGAGILIGSAADNLDRYTSGPKTLSASGAAIVGSPTVQLSGGDAYNNSWDANSVLAGAPVQSNVGLVEPEQVTAFELGYRAAVLKKISLDVSGYYNKYENFIGGKNVISPMYGEVGDNSLSLLALQNGDYQVWQTYTNSNADVTSYGASAGLYTKVGNGFELDFNYTYSAFDFDQESDPNYEAGFNTPEHAFKASLGNPSIIDNLGFKFNYRWQSEYLWQSSFADGTVSERSIFDAQFTFAAPKLKSQFKVGGSNIFGNEYVSAPGVGYTGSQYFASWTMKL